MSDALDPPQRRIHTHTRTTENHTTNLKVQGTKHYEKTQQKNLFFATTNESHHSLRKEKFKKNESRTGTQDCAHQDRFGHLVVSSYPMFFGEICRCH
jgi:hypothetical protein